MNQDDWERNKALKQAVESETIQQSSLPNIAERPTGIPQEIIAKAEPTERPINAIDGEKQLLQMEAAAKEEKIENEIAKVFGTNHSF